MSTKHLPRPSTSLPLIRLLLLLLHFYLSSSSFFLCCASVRCQAITSTMCWSSSHFQSSRTQTLPVFSFVINKRNFESRTSSRVGRISCSREGNFLYWHLHYNVVNENKYIHFLHALKITIFAHPTINLPKVFSIYKSLYLRGANSCFCVTKLKYSLYIS